MTAPFFLNIPTGIHEVYPLIRLCEDHRRRETGGEVESGEKLLIVILWVLLPILRNIE